MNGKFHKPLIPKGINGLWSKIKDKDKISAIKFTNIPTIEVKPTNDKEEFKQNFDLYYKRIAEDDTFASLYEEVSNYLIKKIKNIRQKI